MSRTRELEVGVVTDASSSLIQDPREAKEPMEQGCVAGEMGRDRGGVWKRSLEDTRCRSDVATAEWRSEGECTAVGTSTTTSSRRLRWNQLPAANPTTRANTAPTQTQSTHDDAKSPPSSSEGAPCPPLESALEAPWPTEPPVVCDDWPVVVPPVVVPLVVVPPVVVPPVVVPPAVVPPVVVLPVVVPLVVVPPGVVVPPVVVPPVVVPPVVVAPVVVPPVVVPPVVVPPVVVPPVVVPPVVVPPVVVPPVVVPPVVVPPVVVPPVVVPPVVAPPVVVPVPVVPPSHSQSLAWTSCVHGSSNKRRRRLSPSPSLLNGICRSRVCCP